MVPHCAICAEVDFSHIPRSVSTVPTVGYGNPHRPVRNFIREKRQHPYFVLHNTYRFRLRGLLCSYTHCPLLPQFVMYSFKSCYLSGISQGIGHTRHERTCHEREISRFAISSTEFIISVITVQKGSVSLFLTA